MWFALVCKEKEGRTSLNFWIRHLFSNLCWNPLNYQLNHILPGFNMNEIDVLSKLLFALATSYILIRSLLVMWTSIWNSLEWKRFLRKNFKSQLLNILLLSKSSNFKLIIIYSSLVLISKNETKSSFQRIFKI